jgi:hypothetical protein
MSLGAFVGLLLVLFQSPGVTQEVARVPRFEYSDSLGCGNVFFHAMNTSKTEVLRVEVDIARLRSSASHHVFDLAALPAGVEVVISLYRHQQINRPNCDDVHLTEVGAPPNPAEVWRPIAGRLEIERGSKGVRPEEPSVFMATIRLVGARFRGPTGTVEEMPKPFTWEGLVGGYAG